MKKALEVLFVLAMVAIETREGKALGTFQKGHCVRWHVYR